MDKLYIQHSYGFLFMVVVEAVDDLLPIALVLGVQKERSGSAERTKLAL